VIISFVAFGGKVSIITNQKSVCVDAADFFGNSVQAMVKTATAKIVAG
jgi:hypothetical protein